MDYPAFYSNPEAYAQQYASQLSRPYACQTNLAAGNYLPCAERFAGLPPPPRTTNLTPYQARPVSNANNGGGVNTSHIPAYLLQPIYPWMKSKQTGTSDFDFGTFFIPMVVAILSLAV